MKVEDTSGTWENAFSVLMMVTPIPELGIAKLLGRVASGGANGIRALFEALSLGKNAGVRVVRSVEELEMVFAHISAGGKVIERPGYQGKMVELADGTMVGLRNASKSGGPTIDITLPGGNFWKIHIQ
jgi:hypothetical protein